MPPDFSDPRWFPVNYLPASDEFRMMTLDIDTIGSASFLDRRMPAGPGEGVLVSAESAGSFRSSTPPAFLFHSAFCGSTLLARALHAPPDAVSLKEPSVLLNLSSASLAEQPGAVERLNKRLAAATTLLARPWAPASRVLIKPTNQANRLLSRMLQVQPESRAILLYSTLEEFLVSCFKKLPLAESRVRWMAQHLLVGSDLAERLGIPPLHAFSLPESCVFTWYSQLERYARALESDVAGNLRTLDLQTLLREPVAAVGAAARWLQLPHALEAMDQKVAHIFGHDSKATQRLYGSTQRAAENQLVTAQYGEVIARTLQWASTSIEPYAVLPQTWKPLSLH